MKRIICSIILICILVLFISGCSEEQERALRERYEPEIRDIISESVRDNFNTSGDTIVCNPPYIRFESGCCLDLNDNGICDIHENLDNIDEETEEDKDVDNGIDVDDDKEINIDKLEIVNFHATNRCYSCITAGAYAKETVETYFQEELKRGIIEFKEIDALQPENREITLKYGPTSSSVWIGIYKGNTFSAEEDTNIWYKLRNKQDFMLYLKDVIENKLDTKIEKNDDTKTEKVICSIDVMKCPDDSFVKRNPLNNCEFNSCPDNDDNEVEYEINNISFFDLSNYPNMFISNGEFNGKFIMGSNASNDYYNALSEITNSLNDIVKDIEAKDIILDTDVNINQIQNNNYIIIGNPCDNKITEYFYDYPDHCAEGFTPGRGIIELFRNGDGIVMIVAGFSAEDTRTAVNIIANYKDFQSNFLGTRLRTSSAWISNLKIE
jgi:hypothetical protein